MPDPPFSRETTGVVVASRRPFPRTVLLGLLFTCGTGRAQTTGSIAGRVTDSLGAPLPGAIVEATSSSLQGVRTSVAGSDGTYRFPAVPPGNYRIAANLASFRAAEKSAIVSLDATATVDLTLELATAEQVVVPGEAPLVDTTATTTGTNYVSRVIAKLPVGRNYADIVRSDPAVTTDQGETQGRSLTLAISGATSAENQWIIDGINTTNVSKGIQGKAINSEFVEEVEVKTGGYQVEYGGALGGVINVITKSGGNEFHGDGFVYYDSSGTSARQVFTAEDSLNAEMRIADYRRIDYGADLGGYLLKDRVWFFGAYDRVDLASHVSRVVSTLHVSTDDRFPLDSTDNLYSGKLTWNVAPTTSVVGTVFADPSTSSGASGVDPRQGRGSVRLEDPIILNPDPSTWYSERRIGGVDYGLRGTRLFGSRGLLTLQVSHHQDRNSLTAPDGIRTIDLTCEGGAPDNPCARPSTPNFVTGGYGAIDGPLDHNISRRDQYRGDFTLYAGDHELRAGGEHAYGGGDARYSYTGGQEVTILNDFGQTIYQHSFVIRSPTDLTPVAAVKLRAKVRQFGAYLQDSWKPLPGLTVNLGLRWDEEHVLDYQGVTVLPLDNEWQPRVGVVWDPWKDGRAKVYGFAGRFYYSLPTFAASRSFADFTAVYTYNLDPVSLLQDPNLPGPIGWIQGDRNNVDRGIRGTHQDEYTVGIERLLGSALTLGLKATYRRLADAIEDRCDFDYTREETNFSNCAFINPGSGERFARGDAPVCNGFADVDAEECTDTGPATPPARRIYRGIELLARQTIGKKLWLQASYVYSSLRGNYDGAVNEGFQQTTPSFNLDFDWPPLWHDAYGRLFLDRPHRFRLDGYWVSPLGLSVGLQAFVESGAPLDKLGYFNFGSNVYLVPRGSAGRLPTQWEANLTLSYPIAVGPATVTAQAYLFNLFNNQIATSRNNSWTVGPPAGYPASIYDPNQEPHDPAYGRFTGRQTPRFFRAAIRVSF
ncbi:MAG TPA: TonB-dependent receptor [Thermoanaerobaculia bacterium]